MQRTATLTPADKKGATLAELEEFIKNLAVGSGDYEFSKVKVRSTIGGGIRSLTVEWIDATE